LESATFSKDSFGGFEEFQGLTGSNKLFRDSKFFGPRRGVFFARKLSRDGAEVAGKGARLPNIDGTAVFKLPCILVFRKKFSGAFADFAADKGAGADRLSPRLACGRTLPRLALLSMPRR
jgi:hypothetical protein